MKLVVPSFLHVASAPLAKWTPPYHACTHVDWGRKKRNKISRGIEQEKKKEATEDNCKFYVMRTAGSTCHIIPKAKKEVWNYIEALKKFMNP